MEDNTLKAAEAEAEALRAQIANTPEGRRLRVLERFISDYRSIEPSQRIVARYRSPESLLKYGRPGSVASVLIEASEAFLKKIRRRAMSGEIVAELKERGVKVPGKNPTSTVSSYLSTCDLFDNVKGEGYGLREWKRPLNEEAPEGGKPSSASSTNGQLPLNS